jgi:single-strand DNA-binding protein
MQRIEIIGHIGQDAEIKEFQNNQVINFSVAVTESYTNKSTGEKTSNTTWFECAKWGNQTQIANFLKKGQQVFISGKPQARAWTKQDGTLVANLGVNVFDIKLLGSNNNNNAQQTNTATSPSENNTNTANSNDDEHDDLPF